MCTYVDLFLTMHHSCLQRTIPNIKYVIWKINQFLILDIPRCVVAAQKCIQRCAFEAIASDWIDQWRNVRSFVCISHKLCNISTFSKINTFSFCFINSKKKQKQGTIPRAIERAKSSLRSCLATRANATDCWAVTRRSIDAANAPFRIDSLST